jgi:23S rRNA (adenine-N6)-dimethyltransferase
VAGAGRSRREWGWHPLVDEWAARVVADAAVRPGDLVFDIGAGYGAITAHLLAAGARVVAVELHPGRAAQLRARFAGEWVNGERLGSAQGLGSGQQPRRGRPLGAGQVSVVQADASTLRLPQGPFRVVASPPYQISSALLRMLLAPRSGLVRADLVLQRAVVQRYVTGRSAVNGRWRASVGRTLPRRAFQPPPRVDSAVLVVRRVGL